MTELEEAAKTVIPASFGFLSDHGYVLAGEQRTRAYAGGKTFTYESRSVRVAVTLDYRGELDATLQLLTSPHSRASLRALTVGNQRPFDLKPPVIFDAAALRPASDLLAGMLRHYATSALDGNSGAFRDAAEANNIDLPTPLEKSSGWVGSALTFVNGFDARYGVTRDRAGQVIESVVRLPSPAAY
jgi:hypothetical protein